VTGVQDSVGDRIGLLVDVNGSAINAPHEDGQCKERYGSQRRFNVPVDHSRRLHRAASRARLLLIPGADHATVTDHPSTKRAVLKWLKGCRHETDIAPSHPLIH
jgi:hypothetical protein